jgi:hypothetical protein
VGAIEEHEFRVPLDAQQKGVARAFDRLNGAVLVAGDDVQSGANDVHRLVVEGVDPLSLGAKQSVKGAAGRDLDALARQRRVQMRHVGIYGVNALVQRAAEKHVDHLRTPADAENGQAAGGRPFEKVELEGVALAVDADGGLDLTAVEGRVDIVTAADDESVEVVDGEGGAGAQSPAACSGPPQGDPVKPPHDSPAAA